MTTYAAVRLRVLSVCGNTDLGNTRKIGFKSIQESIDTTTSGGKLVFHIFGALAEFERDIIRERTQAGLQAARARGRKGGRPKAKALNTPKKITLAQSKVDPKVKTKNCPKRGEEITCFEPCWLMAT